LPSTIGTDPKVNVWVEVETCQPSLSITMSAVLYFTVLEMVNRSKNMANALSYCFMKR
jgi:hypothetical protein